MHIKNSPEFAAVAIHLLKESFVAQGALTALRLLTCMAVQLFLFFFIYLSISFRFVELGEEFYHFPSKKLPPGHNWEAFCFQNVLLFGNKIQKKEIVSKSEDKTGDITL